MCPRQQLKRKRELRVHANGCRAREGDVSTSMVDMQGRVMCPHQRLIHKRGLRACVNG